VIPVTIAANVGISKYLAKYPHDVSKGTSYNVYSGIGTFTMKNSDPSCI